jgi:hypothetical protein
VKKAQRAGADTVGEGRGIQNNQLNIGSEWKAAKGAWHTSKEESRRREEEEEEEEEEENTCELFRLWLHVDVLVPAAC